jgi:hypothetical protein
MSLTTNLTLEEIGRIRANAAKLMGMERQQYLAGVRDGIHVATETDEKQEGTLAGGAEIQAFYDFLDLQSASSESPQASAAR